MVGPCAALIFAAMVRGFTSAVRGGIGVGLWVGVIAIELTLLVFTLGAALGGLGAAVRGDPATPYLARGRVLFLRALGTIALTLVAALPSLLLATLGVALTVVAVLSLAWDGATGWPTYLSLGVLLTALVLGFVTVPFVCCLASAVFVGERTPLAAFRSAFAQAYRGGRLWRWLLVAVIAAAPGAVAGLLCSLPGGLGTISGLTASVLAL
jgi:hypothetical protein